MLYHVILYLTNMVLACQASLRSTMGWVMPLLAAALSHTAWLCARVSELQLVDEVAGIIGSCQGAQRNFPSEPRAFKSIEEPLGAIEALL